MLDFPFICRFCLIPSKINPTIGIFEEANNIRDKIFELTNVQVVNQDGLPQEVCFVCCEQIDLSVTFKKQVLRADCMLREYLSQQVGPINSPDPLISGDLLSEEQKLPDAAQESEVGNQLKGPDLLEIKEEPSFEENNEVDVLKLSLLDGQNLGEEEEIGSQLNRQNKSNSALESTDASYCDLDVKDEEDYDFAVAMPWPDICQSEDPVENSTSQKKDVDETKEDCLNKDRIDENISGASVNKQVKQEVEEEQLPLDVKEVEDNSLTYLKLDLNYCDRIECNCKFCKENKKELKLESEESADEELVNSLESQGLRRSSRQSKVPERHVVPHYSCSKCERMYNDQVTLVNHEKTHLVVFKCNHCGKKFSNKDNLSKHIQTVHIGKSLKNQCEICGKAYEKRPHLFSHMRSHKSTVKLCEICGKTLSLTAYPAHKRSHSNSISQTVFQCDLCEKKFNNKMSLRTHKNSYHGTLKFTCEVCGKQFTTMVLMKHHQNSHSSKRDHVCQICSRAFTLKITLKTHMRIHTGETPYTCNKCGRSFTWKTTYRNHVKSCRGDKSTVNDKPTNSIQHSNVPQIPENIQESPIDFSEEAKHKLPEEYINEAKYRLSHSTESKFPSAGMNLSEGMKYSYQHPMHYNDNVKPYLRNYKPTL